MLPSHASHAMQSLFLADHLRPPNASSPCTIQASTSIHNGLLGRTYHVHYEWCYAQSGHSLYSEHYSQAKLGLHIFLALEIHELVGIETTVSLQGFLSVNQSGRVFG